MSDVALYAVIITFLAIILGAITFFNRKKEEPARPRPQPRPVPVAGGGLPNRAAAQRNARARMRAAAARHDDESGGDSDQAGDLEDEVPGLELPSGKIGKKKLAKLQAKAEKKAMREAEERERAEKKEKEEEEYEERKKREELRAAEEAKRKEEEAKALEERKRREHEEYLLMKASFEVEEEGFKESEEKETNLLEEFVQYIKDEKVVVLEELALKFSLKTQDVINRVMDLQNDGVISGVIDDRGKFIYITMDEMNAVAKFIKQRGRISIADLAESSNQLINLTPVDIETSSAS